MVGLCSDSQSRSCLFEGTCFGVDIFESVKLVGSRKTELVDFSFGKLLSDRFGCVIHISSEWPFEFALFRVGTNLISE